MNTLKEKKFYSVKQLLASNGGPLPLSSSAIYAAIKAGEIPAKRIGRRILIPRTFVQSLNA